MNYTTDRVKNTSTDFADALLIPHCLEGFINSTTTVERTEAGSEAYCFHGDLLYDTNDFWCTECGQKMHIHDVYHVSLRHVSIGAKKSFIMLDKHRFQCPHCQKTVMQKIPFQAEGHRMTKELQSFVEKLLFAGFTNKEISGLTGVGQHTVRAIDENRMNCLYREWDEKRKRWVLRKPEEKAKYLAIDEFKLHNGHKYATHIINLETGHVLWVQKGKKKQIVYDFIEHVGMEWMESVEAVACDMNSDFQEAFEELCPHVQPVYDHFHIVKNFNDKVIGEVRKEEQRRLEEIGDKERAKALKGSKYILTAKRDTLKRLDERYGSAALMKSREERYNLLLEENKLLFTADLVKEQLDRAFRSSRDTDMANVIDDIIDTCEATGNRHFHWFARLLRNHYEGIIAHASIPVSTGKIEGINNKIKSLRRQAYGYPDDDYFFLKLFDWSRQKYVRNPKAHRISH